MSIHRFGQFLINHGIVDEDTVYEALNIQKQKTIPIGKIALAEKMLDVKQIFRILNDQLETPKLFGEIARELGYLNENDVQKLLTLQKLRRPRIGQILVEMNKIDQETCNSMLEAYLKTVRSTPCAATDTGFK